MNKYDYRKFASYSLLAKNFLKDKININVYHDPFDLVRQEIWNITEDESFPNTEHNFYEYFCKNYLKVNEVTNKFLNLGIPNLEEMIDIYYKDSRCFKKIILEYCKTEKLKIKFGIMLMLTIS